MNDGPLFLVGKINAEKCVRYLRSIGVEVSAATEREWVEAQANCRRRRREAKRSCGHFRVGTTAIFTTEGKFFAHYCQQCGASVDRQKKPKRKRSGARFPEEDRSHE